MPYFFGNTLKFLEVKRRLSFKCFRKIAQAEKDNKVAKRLTLWIQVQGIQVFFILFLQLSCVWNYFKIHVTKKRPRFLEKCHPNAIYRPCFYPKRNKPILRHISETTKASLTCSRYYLTSRNCYWFCWIWYDTIIMLRKKSIFIWDAFWNIYRWNDIISDAPFKILQEILRRWG